MTSFAPLATLLGWTFLPRFFSGAILSTYYSIRPTTKPKTAEQARSHARAAHLLVVGLYLLYTLHASYASLVDEENFYSILNLGIPSTSVTSETWDKQLKTRWRILAKQWHPDRLKSGSSDLVRASYEHRYVRMRRSFEVLSDPVQRLAYDRFGWALIHGCGDKCTTKYAYLMKGLQSSLGFYAAAIGTFIVLSILRRSEFGSYWRHVSLFTMFAIEFDALIQPEDHMSLASRLPFLSQFTTAEHLLLLHQLFLTFNCAISQIGPVLFPPSTPEAENNEQQIEQDLAQITPYLNRLDQLSAMSLQEADRMFFGEVDMVLQGAALEVPIEERQDRVKETLQTIKGAMVTSMTEMRVRSSAEGQAVWQKVIQEKNQANEVIVKEEDVELVIKSEEGEETNTSRGSEVGQKTAEVEVESDQKATSLTSEVAVADEGHQ